MNKSATVDVLTISTEDLAAKLRNNEDFEFWNVLTSEYYSGVNIAGSRHVPLDLIGREVRDSDLPKGTEIIVYCAGPECPQSASAFEKLRTLGYSNVRAYEGGLEEWIAAGLQTVKDGPEIRQTQGTMAGAACH